MGSLCVAIAASAVPHVTIARGRRRSFDLAQSALALELLGQRVGVAGEQTDIGADSDKEVAPLDVSAGLLFIAGEHAGGLADLLKPRHGVFHRGLGLRMLRITEMPKGSSQVGRTNKDAVDAVDV